jgi:transporter family-2 protein
MTGYVFLIVIAIIGGVAVTLQGQFMGLMDQGIGTRESVFITYAGGGLVIALAMLAARGGNLKAWQAVPWYALSAGLFGLLIVGSIGYSVPRLGLATAFTVMVAAQFIMAALVDHFGWLGAEVRPMELPRLAGVGLLVLSVWLITR